MSQTISTKEDDTEANVINLVSFKTRNLKDRGSISPNESHDSCTAISTKSERSKFLLWFTNIFRIICILACLYFFICSLDVTAMSLQLLLGETPRRVLRNSELLSFPITGLMIGMMFTIMVQSSSITSSIFITMLAADVLTIDRAVFMLMGANIGTTITNTMASLVQIKDRDDFGKAFAGATVHDMFNWLTVLVLLPLEVVSSYLQRLSAAIVESMNLRQYKTANQDLLRAITVPLTHKIIEIDLSKVHRMRSNETTDTLLKWCCVLGEINGTECIKKCDFAFVYVAKIWSDQAIGGLLLFLSVTVLIFCLVALVKILKQMLLTTASESTKAIINSNKLGIFKGYIAIVFGMAVTLVLQSSSVFTSTLTPLVGTGFLSLELMFSLSIGSNVGTTLTGILAALAADNRSIHVAMQAAMMHLFFNVTGIVIWYPIPWFRAVPICLARKLGQTVKRYRWFAVVYILVLFLLLPGLSIGLALIHWLLSAVVGGVVLLIILILVLINFLQKKKKEILPKILHNWKFLPSPLRSLRPYDKIFVVCYKNICCCHTKSITKSETLNCADDNEMLGP